MIVLLLFVYPLIGANQLVGTDLSQAVPLTAAAAVGALFFGHVEFGVTASVAIGSVPAVLVGSFLSARAPDRYIRPVITYVIFASGLKYVGVPTTALGITLAVVAVGGLTFWLVRAQPWRRDVAEPEAASAADAASAGAGSAGAGSAGAGSAGAGSAGAGSAGAGSAGAASSGSPGASGPNGAATQRDAAVPAREAQVPDPVTVPPMGLPHPAKSRAHQTKASTS